MSNKIRKLMLENIVTIIFIILCIGAIIASKLPIPFVFAELLTRIGRNSFLVMALIIPVIAGMGLNFGIVIGAMAAQIVIIFGTHFGVSGFSGFLLCALFSVPVALLFGWMTGKILNKTTGQEMITSMILGFFANGLYQLLFLFMVGTLIPMDNPVLVISGGVGIKNTIDLTDGLKYSVDNIWKVPLPTFLMVVGVIGILLSILFIMRVRKGLTHGDSARYKFYSVLSALAVGAGLYLTTTKTILSMYKVPMVTYMIIAMIGALSIIIFKTKIGQDLRTVGQDKHIAHVSGINVSRTRIISIMISTVLAAWGQLIFLQNLGTLNTYGSHVQIATFAIAALLIGGASVSKATVGQALLGVVLFHTLFIVSPAAGKNLFGNAQIGEYFRTFVAYGVIGLSLGLHAWKNLRASQMEAAEEEATE